jgi:hypothetical protein
MNITVTIQMNTQSDADILFGIAVSEGVCVHKSGILERTLDFDIQTSDDRTSMRRLFTVIESLS